MKKQAYTPTYHVHLRGVLYKLLKKSGHTDIHDKTPFKFLVFSNIFPPKDMKRGDKRTFLIASPDIKLIEDLSEKLENLEKLASGLQQYRVLDVSTFDVIPDKTGTMITGTPIVVRIPSKKCKDYNIDAGQFSDVYWKLDHNTKAFIDCVEKNLAQKYRFYYGRDPPQRPYFTGFKPRKQIAVPIQYGDKKVTVIGTTWELDYECGNRDYWRIIRLAYDSGVGELNTTGFGFMNKVEN